MIVIAPILALLRKRGTWITIAVAIAVVLAGFAVTNYVTTKSENMVLKQQIAKKDETIKQYRANAMANAEALKTRNELVTALGQVEVQERVKTVKALEANPDWANQPIPADVLISLRR